MRSFLIVFVTTGLLLGQEVNPRELVRQSIDNGREAWLALQDYSCLKLDTQRKTDANGKVIETDSDLYRVLPIYGTRYERLVQHNGEPLSPEDARQQEQSYQEMLNRRQNETPAQRAARLKRAEKDRSYLQEVPDAFDFRLLGEEELPTGPAYVIEAKPHPGYQPKSRYAKAFSKMSGKLWIDKKDLQWVKADALASDNVSFGYILARLAKGSNIILEQQRLPDGTWVPKGFDAKASARILLFFNRNINEQVTYSEYRKGGTVSTANLGHLK